MSSLSEIKFARVGEDLKTELDAAEVLVSFSSIWATDRKPEKAEEYRKKTLIGQEPDAANPRVVVVGYHKDLAVTAALGNFAVFEADMFMPPEIDGLKLFAICQIATDTAFRNFGFGRKLVDNIEDVARAGGCDYLYATWIDNERARAFWVKNGFVETPYLTFASDMWRKIDKDNNSFRVRRQR